MLTAANLETALSEVERLKTETVATFGRLSRLLYTGGWNGLVASECLPAQNAAVEALDGFERAIREEQGRRAVERSRQADAADPVEAVESLDD